MAWLEPILQGILEAIGEVFVSGFFKRLILPALRVPGVVVRWVTSRNTTCAKVRKAKDTPLSIVVGVLFYVGLVVAMVLLR